MKQVLGWLNLQTHDDTIFSLSSPSPQLSSAGGRMVRLPTSRADSSHREMTFPGYELRENSSKAELTLHPLVKTGRQRRLHKRLLATLSGVGSLHSSTGEVGAVRYNLPVRQAHGTQVGDGFLLGDGNLLRETYMDSEHTLQISDGRRIPVLLTRLSSNGAQFRTTGPIPGFENSFAKAREGVMVKDGNRISQP